MRMHYRTDRLRDRAPRRRGATAVELALTMMVFVMLVMGIMEFSMLVFQRHVANHAARQVARKAIVHGEYAREDFAGGPWGPETYGPILLSSAADGDPIADAVREEVLVLDPARTRVRVEWLNGDNHVGSQVRVQLVSETDSLAGMFFQEAVIVGESVMLIAH